MQGLSKLEYWRDGGVNSSGGMQGLSKLEFWRNGESGKGWKMGRVGGGGEARGWGEDLNVLVILTQRSQGTKKCPWRPEKLPDLRTNRNQQKNRWKY